MQEVQVETYGSMDKEEKVDYILEQVYIMQAYSRCSGTQHSNLVVDLGRLISSYL
jgi:hypothetical protein